MLFSKKTKFFLIFFLIYFAILIHYRVRDESPFYIIHRPILDFVAFFFCLINIFLLTCNRRFLRSFFLTFFFLYSNLPYGSVPQTGCRVNLFRCREIFRILIKGSRFTIPIEQRVTKVRFKCQGCRETKKFAEHCPMGSWL